MKKALQLASVASMIDQFNIPNIQMLLDLGYKVDVVADFSDPGTITNERAKDLKKRLKNMGVRVFDIAIPRSLNPKAVLKAYRKVKILITREHYNLIHCHSPIGGVICRQAAKSERKHGTRVIYTAHGFHFYDGAPLKNWLIFYPIEKWYSRYTDALITINKEDYRRAKTKFHAKRTVYVPGVGVDTEKFGVSDRRKEIREELGIASDSKLLISVGELSDRKNHQIVVRALNKIDCKDVYYLIVGKGNLRDSLLKLDRTGRLKLLGYRTDVADLMVASDIFVFPSLQEGLPVALMEAMASGLPIICSKIRGNTDLIDKNGGFFFEPDSVDSVCDAISRMLMADRESMGVYNHNKVYFFDSNDVNKKMLRIYKMIYK